MPIIIPVLIAGAISLYWSHDARENTHLVGFLQKKLSKVSEPILRFLSYSTHLEFLLACLLIFFCPSLQLGLFGNLAITVVLIVVFCFLTAVGHAAKRLQK